jgi:glycosyltransferase involved in cell wall biosynthesis
MSKGKIYCTVTNDLNQDQRMHRICSSMTQMGFDVTLVGRTKSNALPLLEMPFEQLRIPCLFQKGFMFYVEYNIRLFLFLITKKVDIIYAVDLDTIMATSVCKVIRRKKLIYDAHEYFTETPELIDRKWVKSMWQFIQKVFVPTANVFLTVNESLSSILGSISNRPFQYLYNVPDLSSSLASKMVLDNSYILYQGMLNEGRGLEQIIEAMPAIPSIHLYIIGEGDLSLSLRQAAKQSSASERIKFLGWLSPQEIKQYTANATLGINLLSATSESYYYSLANKFFDYMHAEIPGLHMDFPEYRNIINKYKIGLLVESLDTTVLAKTIQDFIKNSDQYHDAKQQCILAKHQYNWQIEHQKLHRILSDLVSQRRRSL